MGCRIVGVRLLERDQDKLTSLLRSKYHNFDVELEKIEEMFARFRDFFMNFWPLHEAKFWRRFRPSLAFGRYCAERTGPTHDAFSSYHRGRSVSPSIEGADTAMGKLWIGN